jgi:hypothetical protein
VTQSWWCILSLYTRCGVNIFHLSLSSSSGYISALATCYTCILSSTFVLCHSVFNFSSKLRSQLRTTCGMHRTRMAPTPARTAAVAFTDDVPTFRMLIIDDLLTSSSSFIRYAATRDFATQLQLAISRLSPTRCSCMSCLTHTRPTTTSFLSRSLG